MKRLNFLVPLNSKKIQKGQKIKHITIAEVAAEIKMPEQVLTKLLDQDFDSDKTILPIPLGYKHVGYARKVLIEIKREIKDSFNGRQDFVKNLKTAYRLIMCNLVVCTFSRKCLSMPSTEKHYNKGSYFNKLFLTRAATEAILKALVREGYIRKNKGNKQLNRVNNYQPTEKLQLLLLPLLYKITEEYTSETELIIFKKAKEIKGVKQKKQRTTGSEPRARTQVGTMSRTSFGLETTYSSDLKALKRINKALSKCTYALKSPVKRIYSDDNPMLGGRLYTRLQGLPDKKARIRINTLFNGDPVAEVDLSANHPRMLMALENKELSPTFYEDVALATNTTRDQVKFFLLKAIGAKDRRISLNPQGNEKNWLSQEFVLTQSQRKQIEMHLQSHYPEISQFLYQSIGTYLQAFEGDILLRTMLALLELGIPSLPIHDAIYVQHCYKNEAKQALERAWMHELGVSFKPAIKIDQP